MRVTKNADGSFVVEDEPMRLEGKDAEKLLAAMAQRDNTSPDSDRERFFAECDRIYRKAKASSK